MTGAGLIPAVHHHAAASFSVAPAPPRRGFQPAWAQPAPGADAGIGWGGAPLAGTYAPPPPPPHGTWAGPPAGPPMGAPQWAVPGAGPYGPHAGMGMRAASAEQQQRAALVYQQQAAAAYYRQAAAQAQYLEQYHRAAARHQQAALAAGHAAQQQQARAGWGGRAWMRCTRGWGGGAAQPLACTRCGQQQLCKLTRPTHPHAPAAPQALDNLMHGDAPCFVREAPPPLPIALDPSGRPFKARVLADGPARRPACLHAHPLQALGLMLVGGAQLTAPALLTCWPALQVFHGVAVRNRSRPERYQASDGRPAWTR